MAWSFFWLRSWDEIWDPSHVARWRTVIASPDAYATPFMHPDVVRGWCLSVDAARCFTPFLLHAKRLTGQEVLLLLVRPQGHFRDGYVRRLTPAGMSLFDYHDPVVSGGSDGSPLATDFWPELRRELEQHAGSWFDICSFGRLRRQCIGETIRVVASREAPYLSLAPYADFDAYLASRERWKSDTLRKMREPAFRFRVHDAGDLDVVLEWLPDLEAARKERYPGSDLPQGYLRHLVTEGVGSGIVRCSSLALNGESISWHVGFYLNGALYWYIPSFASSHRALSPGRLHLCWAIKWLFDEGGDTLDFLLGADTYKLKWTDGAAFEVVPLEIRSAALASAVRRHAAPGIRRITRQVGRICDCFSRAWPPGRRPGTSPIRVAA